MGAELETLYDLCEATAEAIELKPGNYYQEMWSVNTNVLQEDVSNYKENYKEACGTAYCRAGWMVALAENTSAPHMHIPYKAEKLLHAAGIPLMKIHQLFAAGVNGDADPGTAAYVKAGADGMRAFMIEHEAKLRSVKLADHLNENGTLKD
jgi:hypothetical protein